MTATTTTFMSSTLYTEVCLMTAHRDYTHTQALAVMTLTLTHNLTAKQTSVFLASCATNNRLSHDEMST